MENNLKLRRYRIRAKIMISPLIIMTIHGEESLQLDLLFNKVITHFHCSRASVLTKESSGIK